jgi:hypothetical protein
VGCSVLQLVAVSCSVLQCVAVCCTECCSRTHDFARVLGERARERGSERARDRERKCERERNRAKERARARARAHCYSLQSKSMGESRGQQYRTSWISECLQQHRQRFVIRPRVEKPCTATHCNALQHIATHCNTLQHTATHYSPLQHTANVL